MFISLLNSLNLFGKIKFLLFKIFLSKLRSFLTSFKVKFLIFIDNKLADASQYMQDSVSYFIELILDFLEINSILNSIRDNYVIEYPERTVPVPSDTGYWSKKSVIRLGFASKNSNVSSKDIKNELLNQLFIETDELDNIWYFQENNIDVSFSESFITFSLIDKNQQSPVF